MDQQWAAYGASDNAQRQQRYQPHPLATATTPQQQQVRDVTASTSFDAYGSPSISSRAASMTISSQSAAQPRGIMYNGDGDGDLPMEDVDPYKQRQPSRPNNPNRHSSQFLDESTAARRYSPMNTSPSSPSSLYSPQQPPYASLNTIGMQQSSSRRQSPTRTNPYSAGYYSPASRSSNSQQLPSMSTFDKGPVPQFQRVNNVDDLKPRISSQPPFRRANPEGGFISPLSALTTHLPATYRICNPKFKYESSRNPRRVLTKPSKGVKNDGYDNEDSDYILYVNDILGSEETGHKNRYLILDVLGQGTFGQVVKCQNLKTQEVVAVKVVKNRTAYFNQSMMEVSVLDLLNGKLDKNDDNHILRLKDTFIHRQHLCLVFELLSVNLYELIKQNQFRGLSTTLVRVFAQQLLTGLITLSKAKLIHCDLKPENILLKNLESPIIKIIDFGSACDERQTVYTYIQSRFYRSPEVLLGLPYSAAIDMWSLGCIVVELFLGLPLFPGSSEYNQVSRITEMLGLPPNWMLEVGKQSGEFFEKTHDDFGRRNYRLKSMEQYSREHGTKEQPSKKYFNATTLPEIIRQYPMPRKNMKQHEIDREMQNRHSFIDFVRGLLNINPLERWTPQQAKLHPFITQTKMTGPFVPPLNIKHGSREKSPAPGVVQQQQAEAMSKQRAQVAQAAQAQAHAQQTAAYNTLPHMNQYPQTPQSLGPPAYSNVNIAYSPSHQQAPPPYPSQAGNYQQQMGMMQQSPMQSTHYGQQSNLYAQATTRAGRQRANTDHYNQNGIPPALQRVISHLDPNAPIRQQPSPAYYPPPPDGAVESNAGSARRRGSRAGHLRGNRDFIRTLEDRTLEEGFMNSQHWQ
ncbi:MAG: dual specificity protein kinase yak1 [Bathelium mastoideum]|nr:MAG: dual specificity protein kinase yak1 [Bathelium mastoideum]KAI9688651.1 MAG: dual specificity protein kinase yak1 [Bathelium mastoideum]